MGPAPTRLPRIALPLATLPLPCSAEGCARTPRLPSGCQTLASSPRAMTHASQTRPMPIVRRSRLRSTTLEPPSDDDTPPPNMSDRPPPLPLWSRTSSTSSELVKISTPEKMYSVMLNAGLSTDSTGTAYDEVVAWGRASELCRRSVPEAHDPAEVLGVEAGATDEGSVDVLLRHDRGSVRA